MQYESFCLQIDSVWCNHLRTIIYLIMEVSVFSVLVNLYILSHLLTELWPGSCHKHHINYQLFMAFYHFQMQNLVEGSIWPMLAKESLKALGGLGILSLGGKYVLRRVFEVCIFSLRQIKVLNHILLFNTETELYLSIFSLLLKQEARKLLLLSAY